MRELAADKDGHVRANLAYNPAIASAPEAVQTLATDKDHHVRTALARNPALAKFPEIIKKLASDKDPDVRRSLAKNRAIPSSTASTNSWQTTQPATSTPTI
ncbi:hypothetical protein [Ferrimicrobium acidiphilum]|uniref:hypothetical protein n=1 Tax=Ferrimicrobium acidiphilum TaxID=121039 RepID=UPI0023F2D3D0|nr:hypothetical protein [Ferrimicrobium acidiphilum]